MSLRTFALVHPLVVLALAWGGAAAQSSDKPLTARTFVEVSRRALPSVVSVSVRDPDTARLLTNPNDPAFDSMMQFMARFGRGGNPSLMYSSSGSGFITRVEGGRATVVTNAHVVSRALNNEMLSLVLDPSVSAHGDGSAGAPPAETGPRIDFGKVRIVGRDELSDLAILEFDVPPGMDLRPIALADSSTVEVGEWVLALGNPLEFNNSVSQGIVSGVGRYLGSGVSLQSLIQTTATINPGNSGGPLVNLDGKVIGINNAIASNSGYWQGIGFAIPSNDIRRITEELSSKGRVDRGYLGIRMQSLAMRPALARRYGIEDYSGVIVERVEQGTPADRAGFAPGDVVVAVDGRATPSTEELFRAIAARGAGQRARFDVVRLNDEGDTRRLTIETELMARPTNDELARLPEPVGPAPELDSPAARDDGAAMGMRLAPNRGKPGLLVEEVEEGSSAWLAGIRPGDVLLRVNGRQVKSRKDFARAAALSTDGSVTASYQRDGSSMFAIIEHGE